MGQISTINIRVQVVFIGAGVPVARIDCQLAAPASTGPGMSSRGVKKGLEHWNTGGYDSYVGFDAERTEDSELRSHRGL